MILPSHGYKLRTRLLTIYFYCDSIISMIFDSGEISKHDTLFDTSDTAINRAFDIMYNNGNYDANTICYDFMKLLLVNKYSDMNADIIVDKHFDDNKTIREIMKSKYMNNNFCTNDPNIYRSILFYRFNRQAHNLGIYRKPIFIFCAYGICSSLIREIVTDNYSKNTSIMELVTLCINRIVSVLGVSRDIVIGDFKQYSYTNYIRFTKGENIVSLHYTFSTIMNELISSYIIYNYIEPVEFVKYLCADNDVINIHYKYLNTIMNTDKFIPSAMHDYSNKLITEHMIMINDFNGFVTSLDNNKSLSDLYIHREWLPYVINKGLNDKWTIHNVDHELNIH